MKYDMAIVVLTNRFVYVGEVELFDKKELGTWVRLTAARNIRVWGTDKGLGQLAGGPTTKTVLDVAGTVWAPLLAVIHIIECDAAKWKAKRPV